MSILKSTALALAVPVLCGMLVSQAAAKTCRQVKLDPKCWGDTCATRLVCFNRAEIYKKVPTVNRWEIYKRVTR